MIDYDSIEASLPLPKLFLLYQPCYNIVGDLMRTNLGWTFMSQKLFHGPHTDDFGLLPFIGSIVLFFFNAFNVPDVNDPQLILRMVQTKRKLDDVGSIELDLDNAILTAAVVKVNAEQFTTTSALGINAYSILLLFMQ